MKSTKCPVCGEIMKYHESWGPYGIEEQEYKYPNKCYYFNFAYGSYEYIVWDCTLGYSYTNSNEYKASIERKVKKLVELAKAEAEGAKGTT